MPELSRFFGIVIRMFAEPGVPHHRPHFHAYYQGQEGVYAIDDVEQIAGSLPTRSDRLVLAWSEIHQEELLEAWSRLQAGRVPAKIDPLE